MWLFPSAIVGFAVAFAASTEGAQGTARDGAPAPQVVQAVAELEERLSAGLAARNRAALEPLIADPFLFVHNSTGVVQSREEWLAAAAQGTATGGQRGGRVEHGVVLVSYGGAAPHTVIRTSRVVLDHPARKEEEWVQQVRVFVRGDQGTWRLASVQGTLLYEGPRVDAALYARYAGTYVISPDRALTVTWEDHTLFARFPNGVKAPLFLASATEEVARAPRLGSLRFILAPDGQPTAAMLVRDDKEVWRASRAAP